MSKAFKHYAIRVDGCVQGVFFRASTQKQAIQLGIRGYVRNQPDGSVYIEAEGRQRSLDTLVQWCHQGPPSARVLSVDVQEGKMAAYKSFRVAY